MNSIKKWVLATCLGAAVVSQAAMAHDQDPTFHGQIEILSEREEQEMFQSLWFNPPGSKWISVRCARRSTCYPPNGFKFRNFRVEKRGSDCKGSQKRRVEINKDFIRTSRECSVRGRVFVVPQEYCEGNYRFCS